MRKTSKQTRAREEKLEKAVSGSLMAANEQSSRARNHSLEQKKGMLTGSTAEKQSTECVCPACWVKEMEGITCDS